MARTRVDPSGAELGDLYRGQPVTTGENAWKALLARNFIATPSVLAWRHRLIGAGGFDERLKVGEDQDFWIRLALSGPIGYVHEHLVRVHERENSLSRWALDDLLTYTLPMIEGHIARSHHRLTPQDIRRIRGERLSQYGRVAYARGELINGLSLLGRSILLGYRPCENAWHIATAAPPAKWMKRRLGYRAVS